MQERSRKDESQNKWIRSYLFKYSLINFVKFSKTCHLFPRTTTAELQHAFLVTCINNKCISSLTYYKDDLMVDDVIERGLLGTCSKIKT